MWVGTGIGAYCRAVAGEPSTGVQYRREGPTVIASVMLRSGARVCPVRTVHAPAMKRNCDSPGREDKNAPRAAKFAGGASLCRHVYTARLPERHFSAVAHRCHA